MIRARKTGMAGLAGLTVLLLSAPLVVPAASAVIGSADNDTAHTFTTRLDIGDGQRACTGALVDMDWVLTAASCFVDDPAAGLPAPSGVPPLPTVATIGRADLTSTAGYERSVVELVPHADRDLMLVKLNEAVQDIAPVPVASTPPTAGETLRIPGYGRTATEWSPLQMHIGDFTVGAVTGADVAATGVNGAVVCAGDTGGPALRVTGSGVELAAVNSRSWQGGCFGTDPAEVRTGAVETRIDDVRDWVSDTAWKYRNVISAVYQDSLGTAATPEQVEFWEYRVAREGAGVLLDAIENTDKYRTARIVAAFEATLGYTPSATQLATHLAWVNDGTRTIDQVEPYLLGNVTYYNHVGGTDRLYITALYQHILHRAPTAENMDYWLERLPTQGRPAMVDSLWSNGQAVRVRIVATYQHFLGVTPTTTQIDYWLDRLVGLPVPTEAPLRRTAVGTDQYLTYANSRF
jgi:hypothetical protein